MDSEFKNAVYYYCSSCGIEINGNECDDITVSSSPASGVFGYCPDCGKENEIEFEE